MSLYKWMIAATVATYVTCAVIDGDIEAALVMFYVLGSMAALGYLAGLKDGKSK